MDKEYIDELIVGFENGGGCTTKTNEMMLLAAKISYELYLSGKNISPYALGFTLGMGRCNLTLIKTKL